MIRKEKTMNNKRIYNLAMTELLRQLAIETERANNGSPIGHDRANTLTYEVEQLNQLILKEEKK